MSELVFTKKKYDARNAVPKGGAKGLTYDKYSKLLYFGHLLRNNAAIFIIKLTFVKKTAQFLISVLQLNHTFQLPLAIYKKALLIFSEKRV